MRTSSDVADIHVANWNMLVRDAQPTASPVLRWGMLCSLFGTLVLLPLWRYKLPFGIALLDVLNAVALPVIWIYLYRVRAPLRLPYLAAMWLILMASLVSVLEAPSPPHSLLVLFKEVYIYVWFLTMVAAFESLDGKHFRLVLLVWLAVVIANSLLLIGQFVSPDLLRRTAAPGFFDYRTLASARPPGLARNTNFTAAYQVSGLVPLLLLRLRRPLPVVLGMLIVCSIVATGSLSAIFASLATVTVVTVLFPFFSERRETGLRRLAVFLLCAVGCGAAVSAIGSLSPGHSARINKLTVGRFDKSADGRFVLWHRGSAVIASHGMLWGIGPDAFKEKQYGRSGMHNDLLAFVGERGIFAALGLVLLGGTAIHKALWALKTNSHDAQAAWLALVIVSALIAIVIQSQFHQLIHFRFAWLVLAVQEAAIGSNQRLSEP